MVTLLRGRVATTRQAPFGHMVTQQRDHATPRLAVAGTATVVVVRQHPSRRRTGDG